MDKNTSLLLHLFEAIEEVSDAEYQVRIWVKGEGPECSSFVEVMCSFFDDAQAGYVLENHKEFGLSPEQTKALETLFFALSEYSKNTPDIMLDADVVKDPKWIEIQHIAKNTVVVFEGHPLIRRKN